MQGKPIQQRKNRANTRINISTPFPNAPHPEQYTGYPFVTLVQHLKWSVLLIVDNVGQKTMRGYSLDRCVERSLGEDALVKLASDWWEGDKRVQFSIYLGQLGLCRTFSQAFMTIPLTKLESTVGPITKFNMNVTIRPVRKRRKKPKPGDIIGSLVGQLFHGHGCPFDFDVDKLELEFLIKDNQPQNTIE